MREVGPGPILLVSLLLAGAWMPVGALGQAPAQAASRAWLRDDLAALGDVDRTPGERLACAQRLITASGDPETARRVGEALGGELGTGTPASLLLHALAQSPTPPLALYEPLAKRLQGVVAREKPEILAALSAFRTRDAAGLILQEASLADDDAVRAGAFQALARLSGRDDLGLDVRAWQRWLENARGLSEGEWRAALLAAHLDRGARLEQFGDETTQRLTESLRRMHLALPQEQRSEFLASLLRDDLRSVRDVGFELVNRELAASHEVDDTVAQAAIVQLRSGDPETRAQAANLVRQLALDSAADPVSAALAGETDPLAAAALLDAAGRWPNQDLSPVIGRWLSSDAGVRRAAIGAAWNFARAGMLGEEERLRALQLLRDVPLDQLGPSACLLLDRLGSARDRVLIAAQLASGSPEMRVAAAQALLGDPAYTPAVLGAALQDPGLFSLAAQAVVLGEPTLGGFQRLGELPSPSAASRREGRLLVAQALPATDLLAAARATQDPSEREDLMDLLLRPERVMSEGVSPVRLGAIIDGALERAQARCEEGRADDALAALDVVASRATGEQARKVVRLETIALLSLGRVDAAEKAGGDAQAWLAGLSQCLGQPQAPEVADALAFRFLGTLSDEQLRTYVDLAARAKTGGEAAPSQHDR